jgi:hypothetical protein
MKYVFLLATVAVVYFFIVHKPSVAPVVSAVTEQEAAPLTSGPRGGEATPAPDAPARASDYLKKPIDRTKAVLEQVKKRNGDGEF